MRKKLLLLSGIAVLFLGLYFFNPFQTSEREEEEYEEEESLEDRFLQQLEQMKDPATGEVPKDRLILANEYTKQLKRNASNNRISALNWQERGPVYDFVGPSNGNSRGGAGGYTAGIIVTALVDLNADANGNVVFAGSTTGGLWRCTNFLSSAAPNWVPVTDFSPNISVASICQDPTNPTTMYLATGDGNTRDLRGYGVWKSTNSGVTWTLLPNTVGFNTAFKILCDNTGNIYLASHGSGLRRSNDGGATWANITPAGLTANGTLVTDIELSSTGRLHASFGYLTARVQHAFTDIPAAASSGAGWTISQGIRRSTNTAHRLEMAVQGNTLYAVTINSGLNIDSCYKSTDGGITWALQNVGAAYPAALTNGQGWFNITLQINPDNASEFLVGGIDAYRSSDNGISVARATHWVTGTPYVHADHHFMQWYKMGTESRIMIGHDGGISQSTDGGFSFVDRNQNLGVKQFYSCATTPTANENYIIGGTQDNGVHQLKNAGLSFSTEVTGGDGAYVHINQQNPQIQFGSYVYNRYRRSTNGGNNWTQVNFQGTVTGYFGYFINPFDYDDSKNIMYASNANGNGNNQIIRWDNANTSTNAGANIYSISELSRNFQGGNASAFKVSPYTADRVYMGSNNGSLVRLDNASTVTPATIDANVTNITSPTFPTAYLNCINTGTSDNTLVAVFSNYGVQNVWYSTNAGASWTAIDGITGAGGLPDMPVWWAVFEPGSDSKLIIGTEAGVYSTSNVNGANTVWAAEPNFPLVRVTQLKVRASDNLLVAATYGRGIWTATINSCGLATISTQPASQTVCPGSNVTFNVSASGTGLTYQWRKGGTNISGATAASYTINNVAAGDAGSYDVIVTNSCGNTTSNQATLNITAAATISTQPANTVGCSGGSASFNVTAAGSGLTYQWRKGGNNISGATGSSYTVNNISAADAGNYDVVITTSCGSSVTSSAASLTVGSSTTINTQPATQTVCAGTNVVLNVAATGSGTLTYQWRKGGNNISGATNATYNINNVSVGDAGSYDVVVAGSCGNVTSSAAVVNVNPATVITTQPQPQTACAGSAANFSVSATGTGTLTYQWRKDGGAISGATSSTYSIASLATGDAGNYDVIVTGSCGPLTSNPVTLTVNTGGGCVTSIPNVDPDVTTLALLPNVVRQNSVLRIKVQRPMKVDWSVVDAQGRVIIIFTQKLTSGQTDLPIQLGRLAAGVYYLHGITEKGKLGTLRFEKL